MRYFQWHDSYEKNNCRLIGLEGQDWDGEVMLGKPLAKQRKKPYVFSMDDEYKRSVRLTDNLQNTGDTIVASPRLTELLTARLGKRIEVLEVHIKDHKGRVATKDYSIINILDLQDCLAVEKSGPSYAKLSGVKTIIGLDEIVLHRKKISPDAQLFRLSTFTQPIIAREDLVEEIKKGKLEGMLLNPVKLI